MNSPDILEDLLFYSEEVSDEMAFYLVPFFYRLAHMFEKRHLSKAQRYALGRGIKAHDGHVVIDDNQRDQARILTPNFNL